MHFQKNQFQAKQALGIWWPYCYVGVIYLFASLHNYVSAENDKDATFICFCYIPKILAFSNQMGFTRKGLLVFTYPPLWLWMIMTNKLLLVMCNIFCHYGIHFFFPNLFQSMGMILRLLPFFFSLSLFCNKMVISMVGACESKINL